MSEAAQKTSTSAAPPENIHSIDEFKPSQKSRIRARILADYRQYWFQHAYFRNILFQIDVQNPWEEEFYTNLADYESIWLQLLHRRELIGEWCVVFDKKIRFCGQDFPGFKAAKEFVRGILKEKNVKGGPLMMCIGWEHIHFDDEAMSFMGFDFGAGHLGDIVYLNDFKQVVARMKYFPEEGTELMTKQEFEAKKQELQKEWVSRGVVKQENFSCTHLGGLTKKRPFITLFVTKTPTDEIGLPVTFMVDNGLPICAIQDWVWQKLLGETPPSKLKDDELYEKDGELCINGMMSEAKVIVTHKNPPSFMFPYSCTPDPKFVGGNFIGMELLLKMGLIIGNISPDKNVDENGMGKYLQFSSNVAVTRCLGDENMDPSQLIPQNYLLCRKIE